MLSQQDQRSPQGLTGVAAAGKFLSRHGDKFYARGVTYGTFAPDADGRLFPPETRVDRDFRAMAEHGVNAVRIYTSPPRWLLDRASDHGLTVMVGLSWEDHVAFLENRRQASDILERVRSQTAEIAGHPAVLCLSVGNEIPAAIVRWHGPQAIESFIERLCEAVKAEDPEALVTYVNYPSTEYLELPFLDIACFNVFLESTRSFGDYVARLHNVAGDRPLFLTEIGLDSIRNSEETQARYVGEHLRAAFAAGCAGAFVFSWTDEWHRGGAHIEDWAFGLTDASGRPKQSLHVLRDAFAEVPLARARNWPRVSVVVCSRNGALTLAECLTGVAELAYSNVETIVVDDGSTDETAAIAAAFGVQLVRTENQGLSAARNTGLNAASGEIVAFLDDDSVPDTDWLLYIVTALLDGEHAGVGGPNIPPTAASLVSQAIANGPGGPIHVLLSDQIAEHIPGCNMAFWKDALDAVEGFDPQFRIAGDDVDICWRLQERGWTLGFCAPAMVWHRRRSTIRSYLKQQREYGRAEALLERKWPERYNRGGHLAWAGRVYATGRQTNAGVRKRIRYGSWGSNLFQSVYDRSPSTPGQFPLMPEWYLLIAALAAVAAYDDLHDPLLFEIPVLTVPVTIVLLALSIGALAIQALRAGWVATRARPISERGGVRVALLAGAMFLLQPLARLVGRLRLGLTPWRRRDLLRGGGLWPRTIVGWSTSWRSVQARLADIERGLRPHCMKVVRGGECDRWDIHVRVGPLAASRLRVTAEEHGNGTQLVRLRVWPRPSRGLCALLVVLAAICLLAVNSGDLLSASLLGFAGVFLALRAASEHAGANAAVRDAFAVHLRDEPPERHSQEEGWRGHRRPLTTALANRSAADEQARTPFRSRDDRRAGLR